jgi:hypothetical protein
MVSLCFDIQSIIFEKLSFRSKFNHRILNKQFVKLLIKNFSNIDDKYIMRLTDGILSNYKHLTSLELLGYENKNKNINFLTNLRNLRMSYTHIQDINSLSQLTNLVLRDIVMNNEGIKNCTLLERLDIKYCFGLTNFNHLTNLTYLNIKFCDKMDKNGLVNCSKLLTFGLCGNNKYDIIYRNLTELYAIGYDISQENNWIDDDVISKLDNIEVLHMWSNHIVTSDAVIKYQKNFQNLYELNVSNCGWLNSKVLEIMTNLKSFTTEMQYDKLDISCLTKLTNLNISSFSLVNKSIEKCTELRDLVMYGSTEDNQIFNLSSLSNLTKAVICHCKITSDSFLNCTDLEYLHLDACDNIDSDSLRFCTKLTQLKLYCIPKITNFNNLMNLRYLELYGTNIDELCYDKCTKLYVNDYRENFCDICPIVL